MEMYILKFSVCLLVFWLVYVFLLERQKMHHFKRFYLLGSFAAAIIIPLLTITYYVEPVSQDFETTSMFLPMESSFIDVPVEEAPLLDLESLLWSIYWLGVFLFAVRFIINLVKLYRNIAKNETFNKHSLIYVLLKEYRIPHSFFKYIFLNKSKFETNSIPKEVLLHEETHARQLHSLDIIILELLQIVFWFHPLIYVLKHHVKLNHEFLADQAVLNNGSDTKKYQNILIQFSSNTLDNQLYSAINYSSFKKRFTVMKTQTSKTRIWLSILLFLPIIAILFYSFADREYVEKTSELSSDRGDKIETQYIVTKTEIEEYNAWAKKIHSESKVLSESATFYSPINEQDLLKFSTIYKRMSPKQKTKSVEFPFPDLNVKTSEQQGATNREITTYNTWAKKQNEKIKRLDELPKEEKLNGSLIINPKEYRPIYKIYSKMSEAQRNEAEPLPKGVLAETPMMQVRVIDKIENKSKSQKGATKKQIAEYNAWAKKINTTMAKAKANNDVNEYPIVKVKEVNKYKAIYDMMTTAQKKGAQPWPSFPPPPPPPSKEQERPTVIEIAEYDVWAKKMNTAIKKAESGNNKSYYPRIKKEDYDKYYNIYSNLMTEAQRENAEAWPNIPPPPPPPPSPKEPMLIEEQEIPAPPPAPIPKHVLENYKKKHPERVKKTKINGELVEIVEIPSAEIDEVPPPPPAPESTLDFVIRMAKSNAKFFNEGKPISSDRAISLLKKNTELNIKAQKTDTKQPLVYISKKPIIIGVKEKSKN